MNETSATTGVVTTTSRCEYTAAFLLLRLFLGLRTLIEAIHKFESGGTYSTANYGKNMTRMAEGITSASFLPLWMTKPYAMALGYVLAIVGAAILLGVKTRASLILGSLVYLSLSFGLMTVQESEGVAWLGMYVLMFAVALVLVRNDRFAVWPEKYN